MRIPRSLQLMDSSGSVHKFWKCHNNDFLLDNNFFKDLYMNCSVESLKHKKINHKVLLNSFCIMDNYAHMSLFYKEGSKNLSNYMRISHSKFGYQFNKISNRSGKVANERPKTPYIENNDSLIRVHMYIEANPIRAGKLTLNQLKYHKYSSYMFYAYGIKNKWTKWLTYPDWYLKLGKTLKECQRIYRELFLQYISEKNNDKNFFENSNFIGTTLWKYQKQVIIKKIILKNNLNST